jgi:hypothetical protein
MRTFARDSILYFFLWERIATQNNSNSNSSTCICSNFLVYLFSTLLGKFGPSEYYQLGAITITVIPPMSANRLLTNMYDSAHAKQPSWTVVSEIKASQQARDVLRSVFSL